MKPTKAEIHAFNQRYFNTMSSSIARRKAKHIDTIIIDSDSLSSGELRFDRAIPQSDTSVETVISVAQQALATRESSVAKALDVPARTAAIQLYNGKVQGSLTHHGEEFEALWIGAPTSIAHHSTFTDTEKEQFLMQARKYAVHGAVVYAVARSRTKTAPAAYNDTTSDVIGLLLFHAQLHHGTEGAVAAIKEQDISIVYASKDNEHTVINLAGASLVADQATIPFVYRPGREVPKYGSLYASLSDEAYGGVLQSYSGETTLMVYGSLPQFWRCFSTYL